MTGRTITPILALLFISGLTACGSASRETSVRRGEVPGCPVCPACPGQRAPDGSEASREPGGCENGDRSIARDHPCALTVPSCRWTEPFRFNTIPSGYAVAATPDEVALAVWSTLTGSGPGCLRVARFDGDLRTLSVSGCLGPEDPDGVWLARGPEGWLLMIQDTERDQARRIRVHRLVDGATALEEAFESTSGYFRDQGNGLHGDGALVQRAAASPVAVWNDGSAMFAAALEPDGTFNGEPLRLGPAEIRIHGTASVGGAVAIVRMGQGSFVLTTIDGEGGAPVDHTIPVRIEQPGQVRNVSFSWSAQAGHLLFLDGRRWRLVRFDWSGALLGSPLEIEPPVRFGQLGPMTTLGQDVILFERDSGPQHAVTTPSPLRLRRISASGQQSAWQQITRDPFPTSRDWSAAIPMGPDALVAWSATRCTSQYVGLARLPSTVAEIPDQQ